MNQKALKVLEYSKIKALWAEQAVSAMCKEKIMGMEPYLDAFVIRDELRSTTEGVDLIVNKGPLPIYGIYDIEQSVNMATKGGTLSMKNLIYISYNLKTCGRVKTFLKGDLPSVQGIVSMASLLDPLESI